MQAIILSIGDELALGQTIDTNSAWLSQRLAAIGWDVARHVTVPDAQADIESAIAASLGHCDALLISGGLGPTDDDLTRQALSAVMRTPLELDAACLAALEAFFQKIGRPMSPNNRVQAMIPRGATPIENTAGTAPGVRATLPASTGARSRSCRVFAMPGVPREMKTMFDRDVAPALAAGGAGAVILSRTLRTFGLGESNVGELLRARGDLMSRGRNPSVGTTVSDGIVSLRLNARSPSAEAARLALDATESDCRAALGDLVYATGDDPLSAVVGRMLASAGKTATTAESCTGGLVATLLTDIPGSSAYFKQGWVTYSNAAKQSLLGVDESLLRLHGAVSQPVAAAMADGARTRAGADFALALSGVAGPDGGTPAKPVGTVCIALAAAGAPTLARTFLFTGDRAMVRLRSAFMALTLLRFRLINKPLPF